MLIHAKLYSSSMQSFMNFSACFQQLLHRNLSNVLNEEPDEISSVAKFFLIKLSLVKKTKGKSLMCSLSGQNHRTISLIPKALIRKLFQIISAQTKFLFSP